MTQRTDLSSSFSEREFYVCFTDCGHFISRFLKRDFSHVFAVEKLDYVWQVYDPTRCGMNIFMPPCDTDVDFIGNMMQLKKMRVIKVITQVSHEPFILTPKPLTCVTALENVIGVCFGFWRCYTPYKFYKLLKQGKHRNIKQAEELTPWHQANHQHAGQSEKQEQHPSSIDKSECKPKSA